MLFIYACLASALVLGPQSTTGKPAKQKAPGKGSPIQAGATATDAGALQRAPGIVRTAGCSLALKGTIKRELAVKTPGDKGSTAVKVVTEQFEYDLPGRLEEEVDPDGTVRFRFTPVDDLRGNPTAKANLRLQDDMPSPGKPPVIAEASLIHGVSPFVFEARGRGQGLIPVSGQIDLRGRVTPGTPLAVPATQSQDRLPLLSIPLPSLKRYQTKPGTPTIVFRGLSPWAWANASGPLTVSGTMTYNSQTPIGKITGSVDITFRIEASKK